jgi:hypothetical protein
MARSESGCETCPVCFAADTAQQLHAAQAQIAQLRTQLGDSKHECGKLTRECTLLKEECASLRCAVRIMQQGSECTPDTRRVVPLLDTNNRTPVPFHNTRTCEALVYTSVWGVPHATQWTFTESEEKSVLECVVAFLERAPSQQSHCAVVGNHLAYKMPGVYAKVKLKYRGLKEFVLTHRSYFTYTADSNTTVGTIHLRASRADW